MSKQDRMSIDAIEGKTQRTQMTVKIKIFIVQSVYIDI